MFSLEYAYAEITAVDDIQTSFRTLYAHLADSNFVVLHFHFIADFSDAFL